MSSSPQEFSPNPRSPRFLVLNGFGGDLVHTSRWNYSLSGGSPQEQTLTGFEGKRIGIIGTGATAVQIVPAIAKHAKELFVFQRTPSSVSWRGQQSN